jgi:hypothetical protein
MPIIHGPHGATMEFETDDPWSLGGVQEQWSCAAPKLCDWPYCECDPVAAEVLHEYYDFKVTVPYTFTNHRFIKNHDKNRAILKGELELG